MAPPSPRRSSRARATNSQSHHSSSSSGASGRPDRNTRHLNKPSSEKSTPSASLSSEPLDDFDDTLLGRRRKRGNNEDFDRISRSENTDMVNVSDDLQDEEDEAVRCLCGSEDYPGPPPVDGPDAEVFAAIDLTDEVTGFFVQCDICKVWQHGACVCIFSAESSPDEYFCEQCRKDLHRIHVASNGQRYSKYLPLHGHSRTTSRATSIANDKPGSSKNSRPSTATQSSKRRSTMNSRDAAYDDEQLQRAIEASKEESLHERSESTVRRGKRGRSDSEENNTASVKRQRTSSRSVSPPAEKPQTTDAQGSEDELDGVNGAKKPRNNRQLLEKSEKEDKERQRQEAANKRKGRAERRRGEDSDLSEEIPLAIAKLAASKPAAESPSKEESPALAPTPGTPPTLHPTIGSSHKRGARSNKRGKGKNQYTKDREQDDRSPARSMSRDIQKGDEATTTGHSKSSINEHKNAKSKSAMANKMTMLDMKRRVAAIMEFISRTQLDLAAESPFSQSSSGRDTPQKTESAQTNGEPAINGTPETSDTNRFKELSCMEMMDVLTRDMVKWQNHYV